LSSFNHRWLVKSSSTTSRRSHSSPATRGHGPPPSTRQLRPPCPPPTSMSAMKHKATSPDALRPPKAPSRVCRLFQRPFKSPWTSRPLFLLNTDLPPLLPLPHRLINRDEGSRVQSQRHQARCSAGRARPPRHVLRPSSFFHFLLFLRPIFKLRQRLERAHSEQLGERRERRTTVGGCYGEGAFRPSRQVAERREFTETGGRDKEGGAVKVVTAGSEQGVDAACSQGGTRAGR
jgi:hypothetical protein